MKRAALSSVEQNGCKLVFKMSGEGIPVVFIQGVGVHGDGWLPQVTGLADSFACATFDNRGVGKSQPMGAGKLSIEQMAADTISIMDAQGWESAHLVGHSMGGLIALAVALQHPKRIRSLSLLCTFAKGSQATKLTPWMLWVGMRTRIGSRKQRQNAFLQLVLPPAELERSDKRAWAARLEPLFGHDIADQPAIVMKQLKATAAYNATPNLHQLADIPTMVISATHDHIAPPSAGKAIAAGIPGAQFIEVEEASHGLPLHLVERTNELLRNHFQRAQFRFANKTTSSQSP